MASPVGVNVGIISRAGLAPAPTRDGFAGSTGVEGNWKEIDTADHDVLESALSSGCMKCLLGRKWLWVSVGGVMMRFREQDRERVVTSLRSERAVLMGMEIFRCAQDDMIRLGHDYSSSCLEHGTTSLSSAMNRANTDIRSPFANRDDEV
jgi:hypothetical protein